MEWTVSTDEQGLRLDKFLAETERLGSRRRASVALDRGKVFVNTVEAAADAGATRLTAGDHVRCGSIVGQRQRPAGNPKIGRLQIGLKTML